jgi:DNA-binding response OmpR family regulator
VTHRILVANPSRTLSALIQLTLAAEPDLRIELVSDGESALRAALRERPDLVLVDLELRGMSGLALAEALKTSVPGARLALTAPDYERLDEAQLRHLRIDEVIARPFERQVLLSRVKALLGEPRAERAPSRAPAPLPAAPLPAEPPRVEPPPVQIDTVAGPALESAIDRALERLLPAALEQAIRRLEPTIVGRADEAALQVLRERAEAVAWKVVPELAESIIREELERLTEADAA